MRPLGYYCFAGAIGLLGLALGTFPGGSSAADPPSSMPAVPDQERDQLIADSIKTIEAVLNGKPDKPGMLRAQTAAIMIAAFAQYGTAGANTAQRAGQRDTAVALAEAIKADKLDEAKKLVTSIKTAKSDTSKYGKTKLLDEKIELEPFMNQFASVRSGGLGIEKKLEDLEDAKSLPADSLPEWLAIANRSIVVADMVKAHPQEKKQKQWEGFADAMAKRADELAKAARAKDAAKTLAAGQALSKSCNDCHTVFK